MSVGLSLHDLRAIQVIWYREILRYVRERSRILSSFAFPIIFLFIFGSGLSPAMGGLTRGIGAAAPGGEAPSVDFVTYIFPGVIGMNVLLGSMFAGISVVYDREFGFLKEILVAPISRTAVALGKSLGGSTTGVIQGLMLLILAPLVNVGVTLEMVVKLIPVLFLISYTMTSLGVAIAARMRSAQGFQVFTQFITFPLIFVSGALFPMRDLPAWMDFVVRINPVTYAIDPLRQIVFQAQGIPSEVLALLPEFGLGVTLFGQPITILQDLAIVGGFAVVLTTAAVWMFNLQD